METLTPKERLELYKKMLVKLKEDREYTLEKDQELYGLCWAVTTCSNDYYRVTDFPELMEIKPNKMFNEDYWWPTDPNNTTRIDMIQEIIERMEKELN